MKPFESFVQLNLFIAQNGLESAHFSCYVDHWLIRARRKMTCQAGKWHTIREDDYESI